MLETVSTFESDAYMEIAGSRLRIVEMTLDVAMNAVPRAQILVPLSYDEQGQLVQVYKSDDFSASVARKTYDLAKQAIDDRKADTNIYFGVRSLGDDNQGSAESQSIFRVEGWRITGASLQPQSRTSPGGVVITAEHPMCELLESPGFFMATGVDYEKALKKKDPANIIEAADCMLDAIYDTIAKDGYTKEKIQEENHYETLVAGAKARLKDYIEPGTCNGFPFEKSVSGLNADSFKKAAAYVFSMVFAELPQSTPYSALISLGKNLGFYVSPYVQGSRKAKLNVLNPWKRTSVQAIPNDQVMSTQIVEDSNRVCGVRLVSSPKDVNIASTLGDLRPFDKQRLVGGETVFFYDYVGSMVNTTVPQFLISIFSRMQRVRAKTGGSTSGPTSGKAKKSPNNKYVDPKTTVKSLGLSSSSATNMLDKIQAATAKAVFLQLHRASQRASVTLPLVSSQIPEIGSFMSFKAGTGGDKIVGMLSSVTIRMSCTSGHNTITYFFSYCGDEAVDPKTKSPLINTVWEKKSEGK